MDQVRLPAKLRTTCFSMFEILSQTVANLGNIHNFKYNHTYYICLCLVRTIFYLIIRLELS
jgi:hypothetical protein